MKAIVYEKYGTPDILEIRNVSKPRPAANEVLIKVLSTAVNRADWHLLTGKPFPVKVMGGLWKPKNQILGADISGVVESVGVEVTQFKPGDEVYGEISSTGFGGFSEYVTTTEDKIAIKPYDLTFEEAAALPMAAVTALQGLRNQGGIQQGQEVLINGASGGVGSYAIQIAKSFGARVTAVCSMQKQERATQLGADRVIDYKKEDFTRSGKSFDLIFDVVGNHSIHTLDRVLKDHGTYVTCAFSMEVVFFGFWKRMSTGKKYRNLLASSNRADLQFLTTLVERNQLRPVIQQSFTLEDIPDALRMIGKGSASGKLVISI